MFINFLGILLNSQLIFFLTGHVLLLPFAASELSEESLPTLLLISKLMKVMGGPAKEILV